MPLALVFPGQGSQSVGMLKDLAASFDLVKQTFEEASDVLGYNLWKLTQQGPEDDLNKTEKTQPALLAAGVAVSRVWLAQGGTQPIVCAGHSLGEYSALVFAGALDFATGLKLVEARGQAMQAAVPQGIGAMAAILGLEDAQVEAVCAAAAQGEVVSPANFNSPGQIVIAGHSAAVDRAIEGAKAAKAKRALKLAVSVPSHCDLMRPAVDRLAEQLGALAQPRIPVIHNVDAQSRNDSAAIAEALKAQLYQPVRWVQCVEKIASVGATSILECGPGKVLVGLNKRIAKDAAHVCLQDAKSLDEALALS